MEINKCESCSCDLTEDDEKFWCNMRDEYICYECLKVIEKCEDESCDCCRVEDDDEDEDDNEETED